jgi:hypothetical protein
MMMRSRLAVLCALSLVGAAAPCLLAEAVEARGRVEDVTVYRGQALVTRTIPVQQAAGIVELVVTDLPERVIPDSLYAEAGAGLEVRSVRFRARPVMEDVNEEVRKIDEQIASLQDKAAAGARHEQVLAEHKGYLAKLEQFVAPTATVELSKGVLDAETIASLTQLLLTQRRQVAEDELKLSSEQKATAKQIELLQRQRATITQGSSRTVREAVVLAEVKQANKGELRLRYLVDQASWTPSYTVRSDGSGKGVGVEYYASIQQMTGEEWAGVNMTLSTATPSLAARGPELAPMTVLLVGAEMAQSQSAPGASYRDAKAANAQQLRQVEAQRGLKKAENEEVDKTLNVIANNDLMLDLTSGERFARGARPKVERQEPDGLSVTYTLAGRTSLPSRNDRQQVQIASMAMPAEFYKVATPALTTSVYEEALARNESKLVLLAGPVSTYVQGRFVGSGTLPTVSIGETFVLGFGNDSSLKARRELVERAEAIQGGNRLVDLTYRLTLENFGSEGAGVRLLDRIPQTREQEIKLTLLEPGAKNQGTPEHRKDGLLRWDVPVPAQAFGEKAFAIEYKVRLEHDKQLTIAGMGGR